MSTRSTPVGPYGAACEYSEYPGRTVGGPRVSTRSTPVGPYGPACEYSEYPVGPYGPACEYSEYPRRTVRGRVWVLGEHSSLIARQRRADRRTHARAQLRTTA